MTGNGDSIIVRSVLSVMVLVGVGVLSIALTGHLWDRYSEETSSLGFSGIYERTLAVQAGFADDAHGYRAAADSRERLIREASALEE